MKVACLIVFLPIVLLIGCTTREVVPVTKMTGSLMGKPYDFSFPKDVDLESMKLSATTNGDLTMEMKGLKTRMNPAVITSSAEGTALMIRTSMEEGAKLFEAGAKAATTK